MSHFFEPYIIFTLGIILCKYDVMSPTNMLLMLCAVISISLLIISKNKKGNNVIAAFSILMAMIFPQYLVFIPAISYSTIYNKKYYTSLVYLLPFFTNIVYSLDTWIFIWIIIAALSVYMAYSASTRNDLESKVKELRDTSVEHELALKEKNKVLLESQDDQIYIATLQERNRIAREIHDNVGHMLSSSILQVGALIAVANAQKLDTSVISLLNTLKDTLNLAMDNIRNSVHDLHDESVDLNQSVSNLCSQFSFCPVNYQCDAGKFVPKEIKYCFITIVKEALNNIIKHSNATKVDVIIKEHPGFYQLLIEDNGNNVTSSPEVLESNGIGLTNMKERIASLNGIIHIDNKNGFKIFISIPKK